VVPDQVRRAVPVDDGHLHVHEDGIWAGMPAGGRRGGGGIGRGGRGTGRRAGEEIVQGFAPVPDGRDGVSELADGAEGDLLVYGTGRDMLADLTLGVR
jgi:hypothetical protein